MVTAVATPTPVETTTAEPGTRLSPINAFEGDTFTNTDAIGEVREVNLKLLEVIDGEEANKIVTEEDTLNIKPKSHNRWVLYHFSLEYIRGITELNVVGLINAGIFYSANTETSISTNVATFSNGLKKFDPYSSILKVGEKGDFYIAILLNNSEAYTTLRISRGYDKDMNSIAKWFTTKNN